MLNKLSLKYVISEISSEDIYTTRVIIKDTMFEHVGNGKGLGMQSVASALFEALEHYFSHPSIFVKNREQIHIEIRDLCKQQNLNKDYVLSQMYKDYPELLVQCANYKTIDKEQKNPFYYPLFLTDPEFEEESTKNLKYRWYSTNNGTASGVTFNEAFLHAMNEIVERDAISLHLIDTFLKDGKVKIIKIDSLPNNLKKLHSKAERIVDGPVLLIDITSDFLVPTFLAINKNENVILPYVGSGTSYLHEYALERAILELIQSYHLHDEELENEDLQKYNSFKKYPKLQRIYKLEYHEEKFSYVEFAGGKKIIRIEEQINHIKKCIQEAGFDIYYSVLAEYDSFICLQVLIPGLEKFHLIRSGIPVQLSERGKKLLKEKMVKM